MNEQNNNKDGFSNQENNSLRNHKKKQKQKQKNKRTANVKIASLLTSTSVKSIADSIISPFIPLYGQFLGASSIVIGFIVSITSLLSVFQIIWAQIAQRFKASRIIALISNYLSTVFNFLFLATKNVFGFAGLRGAQSIISSAAIPTTSALLAERTQPKDWGFWNSIVQGMLILGTLIGTLVGGVILTKVPNYTGYLIIFICAGGLGIISAIFFHFGIPSQRRLETKGRWIKVEEVELTISNVLATMKTERNFILFCLVNFIFVFGVNLSGPFYIIFNTSNYHLTIFEASILTTVGLVPQIISSIITSKFIEKVRKKELVILGAFITSLFPISYIIPFLVGRQSNVLWILIIIWVINGTAWGVINSSLITLALDIIHPRRRTLQLAINNSINAIALFVAPILGGLILEKIAISYLLFIISGAIRFIGGILFIIIKEPIIGGTILRPINRVYTHIVRSNIERQVITLVTVPKELIIMIRRGKIKRKKSKNNSKIEELN
ncbi:MAG: MFS transporter [Candidatus Heimdallarchaeota archaeon]|nr:MFS transporter [Candidatus Heimdallarchaeota archaeon]